MVVKTVSNPERSFGVSVGSVLCLIAALLMWRARLHRAEIVGGIGTVLLVCGLAMPTLLKWPSAWWWRFARALGHVNARVLLTIMFVMVLVPVSLFWRLSARDPLSRRKERWRGWLPSPAAGRGRTHYLHMY
jgi:multisubunit Na+/H+ antiporter MnhG subunit